MRSFLDLSILVFATLRLIRLVTTDDLGWWFIRRPAYLWASFDTDTGSEPVSWRQKLVIGLECPFCVGYWLGSSLLLALCLAGGPGPVPGLPHEIWEYGAGSLALNYIAAHVAARLDGMEED